MKRFFIAALLLSSFLKAQTNTMLNGNFWKNNPTITLVKEEIAKGNNPAEANGGNHDVVSMAINNGADFETIKFLIEQPGNSVTKNTHDGRQYIHWAASKGNVQLVDYLIKQGSDLNKTDDKGATPLVFAASNGQTNPTIYKLFFKAGIKPKQKYTDGATILLMAIANDKDLALTEFLTEQGLSINDKDDFGRTAFDYAAKGGNTNLLNQLLKIGIKPTDNALLFAAQGTRSITNSLDTYQYLVEDVKLNPNVKGANGETVLHLLAKKPKQTENVTYFINKGVDVNNKDINGNNVLMIAASGNDEELVKTILAKTNEINEQNNHNETAIFSAIQTGSPEIVNLILDQGAKSNIDAKNGNPAAYLIQAYRPERNGELNHAFAKKLDILSNTDINFNQPTTEGNTLYHLAVLKNDLNLLKAIEPLKININAVNKEGYTALHKAALVAQNDEILNYLIELGADKTIATEFEETAYDLASENEILKQKKISINFLK